VDGAHRRAREVLEEHRGEMEGLSRWLVEKETISGEEMGAYIRGERPAGSPGGEAGSAGEPRGAEAAAKGAEPAAKGAEPGEKPEPAAA
jgi:hypothetical protein